MGGGNSVKIVLPLYEIMGYTKIQKFAPVGSVFFPFRVDHI